MVTLRDTSEEESNQVEDPWVSSFKMYRGASWEINLDGNKSTISENGDDIP